MSKIYSQGMKEICHEGGPTSVHTEDNDYFASILHGPLTPVIRLKKW
ncbi:MAG: hypothetical protein P4L55_10790 [Syntrophobacteraceae bacterium]|nr:hypothetical protein [Syntrophobacteraceae bacterium]